MSEDRPTKRCSMCKLDKDLERDFHKLSHAHDGRQWYCRKCLLEYNERNRLANKERRERRLSLIEQAKTTES